MKIQDVACGLVGAVAGGCASYNMGRGSNLVGDVFAGYGAFTVMKAMYDARPRAAEMEEGNYPSLPSYKKKQ